MAAQVSSVLCRMVKSDSLNPTKQFEPPDLRYVFATRTKRQYRHQPKYSQRLQAACASAEIHMFYALKEKLSYKPRRFRGA
jgi:hypothetical protein